MTLYAEWLDSLTNAGLRDDLPPLMVGTDYALTWELAEHPLLGNWEDGDWLMQAKTAPGTEGTAVAEFTVTSGTLTGGVNPVGIAVPVADQGDITEPAAPGLTNLYFTTLYTPPGGSPTLVRAGIWPVQAGVSAA